MKYPLSLKITRWLSSSDGYLGFHLAGNLIKPCFLMPEYFRLRIYREFVNYKVLKILGLCLIIIYKITCDLHTNGGKAG